MMGFSWKTRIDDSGRNGMTYTALGASNTCGHGLKARELPFQALLYLELRKRHSVRGFQPSCIAAMGPEYPSSLRRPQQLKTAQNQRGGVVEAASIARGSR
jgi:hypothetical protein